MTGSTPASAAARTTAADRTWGQGAFNADDISRAAVVYLRHWRATGSTTSRRRGVRDAARPHLPADRLGPERRQRGAVDAARRHAEPERRARGAARPVRQRRVLLAGPHDLGARRGLRGLPARRPGVRALPAQPDRARRRRGGPSGPGPVRRPPRHRRPAGPGLAHRRRRRRLRGGGPRALGLRRRRRLRRRPHRAVAAQRGHRRAARRRRPPLAHGSDPALGAVPLGLARLGRHDAGRPGPRLARPRRPRPPPRRP